MDCYDASKQAHAAGSGKIGLAGSYICDVTQQFHRNRASPLFPAVARSSLLVSMSKDELFTPNEIDFAMGWPCIRTEGNASFAELIGGQPAGLSAFERRQLSGNGMVLRQLGAWQSLCFSCIAKRSSVERLLPGLAAQPAHYDQDELEDE